MQTRAFWWVGSLACLALIACRDRGDSPPIPGATAADYCDAANDHASRCGNPTRDRDMCIDEVTCLFTELIRADARRPFIDCVRDRECGVSDDRCATAAGLGITATEGSDAFTTACLAKRDTCGGGFSDDYCFFEIGAANVLTEASDCIDLTCNDIAPCLQTIYSCQP